MVNKLRGLFMAKEFKRLIQCKFTLLFVEILDRFSMIRFNEKEMFSRFVLMLSHLVCFFA